MRKQEKWGIGEQFLNQSIREVKWKDWPMLHGSLEVKARPLSVLSCSHTSTYWVFCEAQGHCILAPVSPFWFNSSLNNDSLLPLFLLHYSSPFLNGNYDPPSPLAQKDLNRAVHHKKLDSQLGMNSSMVWPQLHSSWLHLFLYILHVSKLMFLTHACHFFGPLLLLFTQRWMFFIDVLPFQSFMCFSRNICQFLLI